MKKNYIVFLFSLFLNIVLGQSISERLKIQSFSDPKEIVLLKKRISDTFIKESLLISNYKRNNKISDSETRSLQRFLNGTPIFYTIDNVESATTMEANSLYNGGSLGLNLDGSGITVGVWDGGKVRNTHQEFGSRITLGDEATSLSSHGTHVTGTILSNGIDLTSRGIAFKSQAKTFFWDQDLSEMTGFGSDGFLVSNHSYGYTITNLQKWRFGYYDQTASDYDKIAEVFPYYQIVKAAGNDRNLVHQQIIDKGGYDLLTGSALSKNVLVVAGVNNVPSYTGPASVQISSFSNWGPTDDGRIKPDISAKGLNVYSTISASDTSYGQLSGTSMAAPAIVGLISLLQQHYKNLNGEFMKSATVRGLICHTAKETGMSIGPDYEFGWGLADAKSAAKLISNSKTISHISENTLSQGGVFTRQITIDKSQDIGFTIAWTDPSATPLPTGVEDNRTSILVNNLDLKVIKDGTIFYPWKLDPGAITTPASQNSENNVDNIEKVFIQNAAPGTYTIEVRHKGNLKEGSQDFSLIADATNSLTLSTSDFAIDNTIKLHPNPSQDLLFYTLPEEFQLKSIKVYDVFGRQVLYVDEFLDNQIKVNILTKGMYLIKFDGASSEISSKFIKN